ncbi:NAD(P)-dependent dehydrogenase, short-chain alcohol dehydrogenase family [Rhizobiales bacterium GAS191]|nr:NAD(P)-dependent dehydrogenase, short-chain alcohol dehydrogenase family [Rhizobiales bacterium GAS191]
MTSPSPFDLSGRVALVSGASSGLGRRFALVLARHGAKLVTVARRKERLEELVGEIAAAGGEALAVAADVVERAQMVRAFDEAQTKFGPVTILVNNAGIARPGSFLGLKEPDWRSTLDINLDAVVFTAQEAARRMAAAGGGAIVNIASVLAFGVQKGNLAYAVSKAAVMQATRAMALELAPKGVRVNAIAPGYFSTEINADYLASPQGESMRRAIPMGRFGQEGELDGALLLLASNAGSFITGTTIVVDGGHLLAVAER